MRRFAAVCGAFAALWLLLAAFFPSSGQRSLFFLSGKYPLWDHVNLRCEVEVASPYLAEEGILRMDGNRVARQDVCYPALAMFMVKTVPNTTAGAWCFVFIGALLYLLSVFAFLHRHCKSVVWSGTALIAFSAPLIFAVQVGNMITYSAAAGILFLAWYDDKSRARRIVAAVCLAFAAVLKIAPVLLGVVYLGRDWRRNIGPIALSAGFAAALLVIPFCWYGGTDAFLAWLENARTNSAAYVGMNRFGIYGIVVSMVCVPGYFHETPTWVLLLARWGSIVLAVTCLVMAIFRETTPVTKIVLASMAMLFLPPTMMIYGSLFILPALLACSCDGDGRIAKSAKIAFAALAIPLRVPLLLGSMNELFSATGLVDLAIHLFCRRNRRTT